MNSLARLFERVVRRRMERLEHGRLTLCHAGSTHDFGRGGPPVATLNVHDPAFFRSLAFGGHIGAAESYARGEWTADNLTDLVRIFARNRAALEGLETGLARLSTPFLALLRILNRNTRRGSARNIRAHYDLGNDFFQSFLDETMTYSCGIFADESVPMREASIAKYDHLCQKLELSPRDRVIEIGSGWGGFAIHAASEYGCRITTTTISTEQYQLARERIAEAGLNNRVTVLLQDYRELEGTFDKLVSIEMVEAVGHQYLETYFRKCASLLEPDGIAALQAIVIQDQWYDPKQRQVDFIKRYIFPGSFVPSVTALSGAAGSTDLRLVGFEDITPHYAETLRRWRHRFLENWERARSLDFDEEFRRLWEFYFCYCEGGFVEAILGSAQIVFAKPLAKATLPQRASSEQVAVVA